PPASYPAPATLSSCPTRPSRPPSTTSPVSPPPSGGTDGPPSPALSAPAAGSHVSNRLPCPGLLCTFIAPSWSRTISCTVARPNPVPAKRVVKNGSNNPLTTPSSKPPPTPPTSTPPMQPPPPPPLPP